MWYKILNLEADMREESIIQEYCLPTLTYRVHVFSKTFRFSLFFEKSKATNNVSRAINVHNNPFPAIYSCIHEETRIIGSVSKGGIFAGDFVCLFFKNNLMRHFGFDFGYDSLSNQSVSVVSSSLTRKCTTIALHLTKISFKIAMCKGWERYQKRNTL